MIDFLAFMKEYKQKYGKDYVLSHIVYSNGSRWLGEEPATIDELIDCLKKYTIEERFFDKYCINKSDPESMHVYKNMCPVNVLENGVVHFFGNFEEYSHVFNIETNDPIIIKKLTNAIHNNKGWHLYYNKNLIK